jgi:peptidoglycan hydrolase-like protein with peptidoglycan-binding domain
MTRKLAIIAAVVLVVGAVAARIALSLGSAAGSGSATKLPPATAKITRTTLVETTTVPGTLGYGEAVPVAAAGEGTLTWIADTGSTVHRGQPLFKLDERPVVALYGKLPPYRTLREGLTGADVRQLEQNLAKLGYTGFTVDTMFAAGTAAAVRDWQTDLGLPQTGTVEPGQVVVIPGPVRIAEHLARVGDTGRAESGKPVLAYTGTTRLVTVELKVTDQALAAKGRKVTVILPGGTTAAGTIADVGAVATAPDQANGAAGQAGSQGQPGDSAQQAGSAASDARIAVTVDIRDQRALGTLQAAPVDVEFVSQKRAGVLAVPVAALLALPEGGYGVEIVEGSTTRIVPVKTGLFAGGRVEISGGRIAAGMNVGMPT